MLLVSTDTLFIRLSETDGWNVAFVQSMFGAPILAFLAWRLDDRATLTRLSEHRVPLALVAALGTLSSITFAVAVTRTAVANVVTIVAAAPIVAAVVGMAVFGERTTRRVWTAIALTIVGIVIVVAGSLGQPTLDGDLFAMVAIAAFGTSINVWRRYPGMSVFAGLALGAIATFFVTSLKADPTALEPRAWLWLAAMGVVFNPLGRICHASAPRHAPASEVALFTPVETVAATVWAWLAFSEQPPGQTVVGAAIIVCALLYGTVAERRGDTGRRASRSAG